MTAEKLEATAAKAATVVNGRIDGGFGPDMAAAVAMNGLTVRGWFVQLTHTLECPLQVSTATRLAWNPTKPTRNHSQPQSSYARASNLLFLSSLAVQSKGHSVDPCINT